MRSHILSLGSPKLLPSFRTESEFRCTSAVSPSSRHAKDLYSSTPTQMSRKRVHPKDFLMRRDFGEKGFVDGMFRSVIASPKAKPYVSLR